MSKLLLKLSKLFVPDDILEHFEVLDLIEEGGVIIIDLIEKSDVGHIPKAILHNCKAVKDGFMNTIEIQTFPAQGKEVFLRLKRRRWKKRGETKGYHNTYDFTSSGAKSTRDFGSFLKEIGRG